jgi:hypothetical protein
VLQANRSQNIFVPKRAYSETKIINEERYIMDKQAQDMKKFEEARTKATKAHDEILLRLFGSVPDDPSDCEVTREAYEDAMEAVGIEYGYSAGNPDLILFVLEQLSRSPRFINKECD